MTRPILTGSWARAESAANCNATRQQKPTTIDFLMMVLPGNVFSCLRLFCHKRPQGEPRNLRFLLGQPKLGSGDVVVGNVPRRQASIAYFFPSSSQPNFS